MFDGKKAQGFGGLGSSKKTISIFLGLVFLAFGLIPVLYEYKLIGFTIPTVPQIVLWVLGVVGGVLLLMDALRESQEMVNKGLMIPTLILGLVLLAFSVVPLLNQFGLISFALPAIGSTIVYILFAIAGLLLIVGGLAMPF